MSVIEEPSSSPLTLDWRPTSPPIEVETLNQACQSHPAIAIHFWAVWNTHDRYYDGYIANVAQRLGDRVSFFSCDIDTEGELAIRFGIANVPTLAVITTDTRRFIVGVREPDELERLILEYLKPQPRRLRFLPRRRNRS